MFFTLATVRPEYCQKNYSGLMGLQLTFSCSFHKEHGLFLTRYSMSNCYSTSSCGDPQLEENLVDLNS